MAERCAALAFLTGSIFEITMKTIGNILFNRLQGLVITICVIAIMMASSCVTNKKITYLQELEDSPYVQGYIQDAYKIQVFDNLYIRVITPDPRWSEMFNVSPVGSGNVAYSEMSADLVSYSVKQDSTVEIPFLGSIHVAGLTISETREVLEKALKDFISDAAITVKLVNNYISILGEVGLPGRYPIYKEQMNIFQALALAGDLDEYSNRTVIRLIRQTPEGNIVKEFNLLDKSIINTEFYYVMPNDVIYSQPMKGKFFAMNQFPFALILSTLTTFVLVMNYIQTD